MNEDLAAIHQQLGIPKEYRSTTILQPQQTPTDLVSIGKDIYGREQQLRRDAALAWESMSQHARDDGIEVQVVSAFRSLEYQVEVIRRHLAKGQSIDDILTRVAAPGYSEHQSGCALDLTSPTTTALEEEFEQSAAFGWLSQNASKFSFVMSYPRDNPFGVIYEPWHWCYRSAYIHES